MNRYPENPSFRIGQKWKCSVCSQCFVSKREFINHLEITGHRVCYACGRKVGSFQEYVSGDFTAVQNVNENGIITWEYKHSSCPRSNPSKRDSE